VEDQHQYPPRSALSEALQQHRDYHFNSTLAKREKQKNNDHPKPENMESTPGERHLTVHADNADNADDTVGIRQEPRANEQRNIKLLNNDVSPRNNHIHRIANIFSNRKGGKDINDQEYEVVPAVEQERALREEIQKRQALQEEREAHEAARQEALQVYVDAQPLENSQRGGSGSVAQLVAGADKEKDASELRAIKAALALQVSKQEQPFQSEAFLESKKLQAINKISDKDNYAEGAQMPTAQGMNKTDELQLFKLYQNAVVALRDPAIRESIDPLFVTPYDTPIEQIPRIDHEPKVDHLGCMVDAGRHYFPISWLKHLIVYLYKLRYNTIHFRLNDDQTFNLQLASYPELANPVLLEYNIDKKTYTPKEIKELVHFAKGFNISIIPEINVPGHAGGFAGIKDLVIMCAGFICDQGYGLPLNVEHPHLKTILTNILKEVLEIFDNPPFLHRAFSLFERDIVKNDF